MSSIDFGIDSFDLHTFDPIPRRRRPARGVVVAAPTKTPAPKAEPGAVESEAPDPEVMEALLAEVAERRAGMAELERRVQTLSHDMRLLRNRDNQMPAIRFMPAAGFGERAEHRVNVGSKIAVITA